MESGMRIFPHGLKITRKVIKYNRHLKKPGKHNGHDIVSQDENISPNTLIMKRMALQKNKNVSLPDFCYKF